MAYIRSDEDYYISLGMNPTEARIQVEAERRCGHDGGYCNPRKISELNEAIAEVRQELANDEVL
jgi:hypothetical protein